MSSLNRLLNEDAPSLAPPPPPPSSSAASSFPASALDFLAEAAMAGIGGAPAPPPASAAGLVDSSRMDGVEPANGSNKPAAAAAPSKQYHLDSSFFPAAPEPSFLPPPQQQRAAFSFPVQPPPSSNSNANGHLTNGQYNPVPNFNFAATAAAQQAQAQGQGHPSSSSSSDPSDVPIPAHLLAWGAEEPLSAAERVKMGRRRVPTVPAPAPAAPSGSHPPSNNNHHAHAPQQQHSSHNSHSSSHQQQQQQHAHNSSSNHSHSHSHQQQQQQHQHQQQQQAHNPYSNSSSSSSVPQHSHNPLGLLPMLPKKEKKAVFVPPPISHSMHQGGGQSSSSMMSGGGTPNGMVRQGYQGERTTSIGSEGGAGASASDSGTNTSGGGGGNVQGQGHPVGPDGQPIVKTGRKRVLGPDGKPMKKVKVPGRGQAWRKGLGGVGTGSAAPKLSTPLELFTAPSGPPRPKKPKKIKNPEDANGGSGSGSANGNGGGNNNNNHSNHNNNHNNNHGGGGGGSHNFNNHGNDPSGSHHGNGGAGGGNNSMPPGEKLPKAPKPKVSKPGTHPKKAMPKFGPELPPNWIPTNLPIAQRPRDPTPPPVVLAVVEEEDDQAVYCICETKYDEDKAMMACDKCQEWYHPECVNISEEKIELVDQFVCPKCEHLTEDRTTWKVKCRSQGCFRPIIPPLTKYCSPSCGVTHLTALAAAQAVPLVSLLPRSTYARRPGGTTVAAEQAVPAPLAPALSSSPSSGAAYPPSYPSSPEDANGQHPLLTTLHASLESVEKDIKESKTKVEVVGKRLELLGRASERAEKIEELEKARKAALAVQEEELKKKELLEKEGEAKKEEEVEGVETGEEKMEATEEVEKPSKASKGKKPEAAGNAAGERVCGFDRRLVFGEREFEEWCATEEGKKALAGEEELVKAGEDVVMKEEGAGEKVEGGWWCEETRKKCDGHAGWQRWRLVDFQMEQQQKEETLSKLEKKRDGVKKEIADLEQEVEARRRLDLKPHSSNSNGFVALPTSNERGGVAIPASERRGSFNANGLGVPSALYSRGGSVGGGGQSSSLETKGSYGSLYGFSNERGGFSSNERGGGGFSSERGGFSNERGGVSNERGGAGDEDVEMDL